MTSTTTVYWWESKVDCFLCAPIWPPSYPLVDPCWIITEDSFKTASIFPNIPMHTFMFPELFVWHKLIQLLWNHSNWTLCDVIQNYPRVTQAHQIQWPVSPVSQVQRLPQHSLPQVHKKAGQQSQRRNQVMDFISNRSIPSCQSSLFFGSFLHV